METVNTVLSYTIIRDFRNNKSKQRLMEFSDFFSVFFSRVKEKFKARVFCNNKLYNYDAAY